MSKSNAPAGLRPTLVIAAFLSLGFPGCTGDPEPTLLPPVAVTGPDLAVDEGAEVVLDGSASYGSRKITSFEWQQILGPTVTINDPNSRVATFEAPQIPIKTNALIVVRLTVVDDVGDSDADEISISVASADYIVFTADKVTAGVNELYKADLESDTVLNLSGPLASGWEVPFGGFPSPDRMMVCYTTQQPGPWIRELHVAAADGSGQTKIWAPAFTDSMIGYFSWAPDNSRIVYAADQETLSVRELYTVRPDGTQNVKISGPMVPGSQGLDGPVHWSPDGSLLAYTADQAAAGLKEIFVSALDGSSSVKVSGPMGAGGRISGQPAWASDGSRIAYRASTENLSPFELFTCRPDGSGSVKVSGPIVPGGWVFSFAWAPDGSRIAYIAVQDTLGMHELYTVKPDGSDNIKVSGPMVAEGDVVYPILWAPDSSRVAYLADQDTDEVFELYTSTPDGLANTRVSGAMVPGGHVSKWWSQLPTWAPDSSRIAYVADQDTDGVSELYASSPDGTTNVRLSGPMGVGGDVYFLFWAPDGSRIAYEADQVVDDVWDVYTSLPDGSQNVRVSGPLLAGRNVRAFSWAPDSSRIAYLADQDVDDVWELFLAAPDGTGNHKISGALTLGGNVLKDYFWAK